jgi:hypothetical protein
MLFTCSLVEVQIRDKSITIRNFNAQVASGDGTLLRTRKIKKEEIYSPCV